jgi:hypothetical protein
MKVTKYRCLSCLDAFDSIEEATDHAEHTEDAEHTAFREKHGTEKMIQMIEVEDLEDQELEHSQEDLESREWTDFPKGSKLPTHPVQYSPNTKKYLAYPYSPYFYDREDKAFLCADHRYGSRDFQEYLKHMREYHSEDAQDFIRHHLKMSLIDELRFKHGSSEHLTDEMLEKAVDDKLRALAITTELKQTKLTDSLSGVMTTQEDELREFLQGKMSHCPICNLAGLSTHETERYREKLILEGLKSGMTQLSKYDPKNPRGYWEQLTKRKYQGSWRETPVDLCLLCNMHAHLRHPVKYARLWNEKILGGGLPAWLVSESYLTKKPFKEELAKLQPAKDKSLSKGEKKYLDYFNQRK